MIFNRRLFPRSLTQVAMINECACAMTLRYANFVDAQGNEN